MTALHVSGMPLLSLAAARLTLDKACRRQKAKGQAVAIVQDIPAALVISPASAIDNYILGCFWCGRVWNPAMRRAVRHKNAKVVTSLR